MFADINDNSRPIRDLHVVLHVGDPVLSKTDNHQGLEEDIRYILQHYAPVGNFDPAEINPFHNQICGAWVEALPYFSATKGNNAFLFFAIKTLATSLRCLNPTAKASNTSAFELYCKSLRLMTETLQLAQGVFKTEHCVAIMCLAISDVSICPVCFVIAHVVNNLLQR